MDLNIAKEKLIQSIKSGSGDIKDLQRQLDSVNAQLERDHVMADVAKSPSEWKQEAFTDTENKQKRLRRKMRKKYGK